MNTPSFWSEQAWRELCAYADRFEDISIAAEVLLRTWAERALAFHFASRLTDADVSVESIEATHLVQQMGPEAWAGRVKVTVLAPCTVPARRPAPSPLRSREEAPCFTQAQADLMHKALLAIEARDIWDSNAGSRCIARLTLDQVNGRLVATEGAAQ
jgi:hypothetical protein